MLTQALPLKRKMLTQAHDGFLEKETCGSYKKLWG